MFALFRNKPHLQQLPDYNVAYTWGPLNFLNLYRLVISGLFVTFYFTGSPFAQLGSHNSQLFYGGSGLYLVSALASGIMIRLRKPKFYIQVHIQILMDIIFTTVIMHASGGLQSGLGTLIIISIAAGSIVIRGRHSLLFASVATISVLFENFYSSLEEIETSANMLQAGILGITFFTTAIITHYVARYIRESEELAQERGVDLANMSQLTEQIIQRMQTGILVIDPSNRIRLINESAWHMLNMPAASQNILLKKLNADLFEHYRNWKQDDEYIAGTFSMSPEYPSLVPRFAELSQEENPATLIFLEDASAMSREAQQLQLAALGRLTASIAHEIRNPLGAISHAGQLLEESPNLDDADLRLTQIIAAHSKRMNTIIENVMQLGKGNQSYPQLLELENYLEKFISDFITGGQAKEDNFIIKKLAGTTEDEITIRFDPSHLQQILTNLCENSLRHSDNSEPGSKHLIEFQLGISANNKRPFLDILDFGSGIDKETAQHIFEPFYTTADTGTGLGLYISRELAECNQAHLTYIETENNGACFRITFSDPRRHMH